MSDITDRADLIEVRLASHERLDIAPYGLRGARMAQLLCERGIVFLAHPWRKGFQEEACFDEVLAPPWHHWFDQATNELVIQQWGCRRRCVDGGPAAWPGRSG